MRSDAKAYIGVDIGTTSLAAVVTDWRGRVLKTLSAPNPSACEPTADGRHEQDADAILDAVNALVASCEAFVRERKLKLAEIGWTGQMHGLVAIDRKLRALTPLVTWRDCRAAPPKLGSGILEDWRRRKVKGIWRVLTIPGYVLARRTGRCLVDSTFRASLGTDEQLAPFAKWLPETDDTLMLGDNQAGVYAALKLKPGAAVVNLGTSGQLSRVVDSTVQPSTINLQPGVCLRPFPGVRTLLCRASHVGGAPLAKLRKSLGFSWQRLNDEAETNPRIVKCVAAIVDDLAKGVETPLDGFRGELAEIEYAAMVGKDAKVAFDLRGHRLVYDAAAGTLASGPDVKVPWPVENGRLALRLYIDRVGLEVFAQDGFRFLPDPTAKYDPAATAFAVTASGDVTHASARVWKLNPFPRGLARLGRFAAGDERARSRLSSP